MLFTVFHAFGVALTFAASAYAGTAVGVGAAVACISGLLIMTFTVAWYVDDWEEDFVAANRALFLGLPAAVVTPVLALVAGLAVR